VSNAASRSSRIRKKPFVDLPVMRSEFHQHVGAGARIQRVNQEVNREEAYTAL
jgi:hypothetical protein